MFQLRPETLARFAEAERAWFATRVADHLREHFPDARSEPALPDAVRAQVERAAAFGLHTEHHAALYVTTAWLLGPGFATDFPEASRVLSSATYTDAEKAAWLERWMELLFLALEE
jgi:hypothetical protein